MLCKVQQKSNFAHIKIQYTYGQTHMYIQGTAVEIQTPTHWNLIGSNMTTLLPVLSPSSILPPLSPYCFFIAARKNLAHISKNVL
jgi:hypothetical protein